MISTSHKKITIIGILNITPDSFFDGGKFADAEAAARQAKQMAADGADIIDIGGESSRPGSEAVSEEEELSRVLPIIERLVSEITAPISIDTYKPAVARACIKAGAKMINDITGLRNPDMIAVAAEFGVPVVIMHMQGEPKTMQEEPKYGDVVEDIKAFFTDRIAAAEAAGVKEIILDPGIGFGKTLEHNLEILRRLSEFKTFGKPILVGTSRKSFIGAIAGATVDERLPGTIASNVIAIFNGATMVRVHDVKEMRQAVEIVSKIVG